MRKETQNKSVDLCFRPRRRTKYDEGKAVDNWNNRKSESSRVTDRACENILRTAHEMASRTFEVAEK